MQVTVTIRFGAGNSRTVSVPRGTTVGDVINNAETRAALSYGSNVRALIGRVAQANTLQVADGDTIDIETVGSTKGA